MMKRPPVKLTSAERSEVATYERALGGLVSGHCEESLGNNTVPWEPGVQVLKHLAGDVRKAFIAQGLRHTLTLLLIHLRSSEVDRLLERYLRSYPAELFVSAECDGFARFLRSQALDVPYQRETLDFEHALIRATLYGEDSDVTFDHDPIALLDAIAAGALPVSIPEKPVTLALRVGS